MTDVPMGRFAEPAHRILAALASGPSNAAALLAAVRSSDGPFGPATLLAALARLERAGLVERRTAGTRPMYRLASHPAEGNPWIEG